MGPGEQQPGGGPWSNPYQQSGYQQPNPYRDPVPPTVVPGPPPGPPGRPRGFRPALAVVVGAIVLAGALVAGAVVIAGVGDDDGGPVADASGSPSGAETSATRSLAPDDPRQGVLQKPDPVAGPDWQVQTNEDRHLAFDVPPEDWGLLSEGTALGVSELDENGEDTGDWAIGMLAPAVYLEGWCPEAEYGSQRASAGTRGGQNEGYTGTEEAAAGEARAWAVATYDQLGQGTVEVSEAEPFGNAHGITGHTATATVTGVPDDPDDPCGTWDGRVVTVSYLDSDNDLATWALVADTGYPEELDDATVQQILDSLRPYPAEG